MYNTQVVTPQDSQIDTIQVSLSSSIVEIRRYLFNDDGSPMIEIKVQANGVTHVMQIAVGEPEPEYHEPEYLPGEPEDDAWVPDSHFSYGDPYLTEDDPNNLVPPPDDYSDIPF